MTIMTITAAFAGHLPALNASQSLPVEMAPFPSQVKMARLRPTGGQLAHVTQLVSDGPGFGTSIPGTHRVILPRGR